MLKKKNTEKGTFRDLSASSRDLDLLPWTLSAICVCIWMPDLDFLFSLLVPHRVHDAMRPNEVPKATL